MSPPSPEESTPPRLLPRSALFGNGRSIDQRQPNTQKATRRVAVLMTRVLTGGLTLLLASCQTAPAPGTIVPRRGDEIIVAGHLVHTGTPIVLWMDPGGYDAYRVE